jgi:carbohydrate-selective porin OprB
MIPLSDTWIDNPDRGPISSFEKLPLHRIEMRVGKFSTADIFDNNVAGSDSHRQFMNWAVDNNAAYDYAADTRGYTYGAVIEYEGPRIEFRFGEMLMPKVANGLDLSWDLARSRAENMELELKYSTIDKWFGTLRVLGYLNHAAMGSYAAANEAFVSGRDAAPDITAHRAPGRTKAGVAVGWVQQFFGLTRAFARWGMNDGANESFAYTEADDTFEIGADMRGRPWDRKYDRVGIAFVTNGISDRHREYLRLGGRGFLLGDGTLHYGRETILEHYYDMHVWRGFSMAADIQLIFNPGYNERRGPAAVFSLRTHFDF